MERSLTDEEINNLQVLVTTTTVYDLMLFLLESDHLYNLIAVECQGSCEK
jgi:hypothetical protein